MRYSIRKKTAVYIIILILTAFLVGLSFSAVFATRYYIEVTKEEMVNAYEVIKDMYMDKSNIGFFGSIPDESYTELTDICEENGFSMLIVHTSGLISFNYGNYSILYYRLMNLMVDQCDDIGRVLKEDENYRIYMVNGENKRTEYVEMWGFLDDGSSFIYRCSYSGIQNSINVTLSFYLLVCVLVFVIFAIILLIIIKSFTEPLKRLAEVTVRVNEGDFDNDYEPRRVRKDEIGVLSENVYEMAHKLERTISELKSSNLNLKNELKAKEKLEEARKKYMSDVSHELKTPIALISGYAEGLKEGISDSPEDRDYYCSVIIDEAEKMNIMVKKLSMLNQLEQGKSAVSLERFNVIEVIDGFLKSMSMIIEEKQVNVFFNNKDVAYVWSDAFLFQEILVNYFNNALNHMNEDRIIRINVEKIENNIRVTLYNSGEHIPEEELPKLWGKFYKVDKARTREYGGSGLGLSIVKAIADSLDKECGVYNTEGGVAFYIDLEYAGKMSRAGDNAQDEKPEKHSRLKLSEIPKWRERLKSVRKESEGNKNGSDQ